ncbi:P-loop containing nucleoside triphosphate hydrolase protein [Aspergillus saccharolyticus JOP 1030-1]|uniref:P-loop containing nucleoside triphosphate hydrolase protein n=1 Tax=Aspergillus saccharolyticus JOP 1030-1 TaxID=1450539 RepID=A0A318Z781_9EURO|nr:P-loop containing nucleoside triphosphate hydrolase protein [Aspergillus saccharolyticus JOP 1030-1]PYH42284.1 P-loop containing nucleoside triphosphate hydrolase protein [Aspergillus saccharolyticus JOP 1030-1]
MSLLHTLSLILDILVAGFVITICLPAIRHTFLYTFKFCSPSVFRGGYQTVEILSSAPVDYLAAFCNDTRSYLLVIANACVCAASLLQAIFADNGLDRVQLWLHLMPWLVLLIQGTFLISMTSRIIRYSLALKGGLAACSVIAVLILNDTILQGKAKDGEPTPLAWSVYVLGIIVIGIFLSYPRSDRAFRNGKSIDEEETSSVLGRLSFQWATPLVSLFASDTSLGLDHLPELSDKMRAKSLQDEFNAAQGTRCTSTTNAWKLVKALLMLYRREFVHQLLLSVPLAVLAFTPQLALREMLKVLEKHTAEHDALNVWALLLGLSIGVSSWLENWLLWTAMNWISVPLTTQLSVVAFSKAMRLSLQNSTGESDDKTSVDITRNVINLVAIDASRIALVAGFLHSHTLQALKLTVACTFLARLLGWQSLLAGLACLALFYPLHYLCLSKYSATEKELMLSRDKKVSTLTEVLQGIRQVKFAGLEFKWEQRINFLRDRETEAQNWAFFWHVVNLSIHLLGPVMVSAVSLSVYSWQRGPLTPSIAFPALSTLGYIQFILGLIPELLSGLVGGKVSLERMARFFNSTDAMGTTTPSRFIQLDNASLSYHTKSATAESGMLRSVTLTIPLKALSVVSGRTGSGKSLLLNAILGECEILSGSVRRPVPPTFEAIYSSDLNPLDWCLSSAMAYVAQTPWIEAGTIRANILFGLPYDRPRYQHVLFACALTQDLDLWDGRDLTEIGPNGVNLSGGQKVRVGLARALYSRAGILLLDDIFSAVDVHTASHLFKHAITGKLALGRTRILVTHNVDLCFSKADYLVELENGTVRYAYAVAHSQDEDLDDSLREETSARVEEQDDESKRYFSCQDEDANDTGHPILSTKYVEEETKSQGALQWQLFRRYIQTSGGWASWAVLAGVYIMYNILQLAQIWSRDAITKGSDGSETAYYLGIYTGIAALSCLAGSLRAYIAIQTSLTAASRLFRGLLFVVLRAPLLWLDKVPSGRLLNRFTADFYLVDSRLGFDLTAVLNAGMDCIGVMMGGVLVRPILLVCAVFLAAAALWYTQRYLAAAREIKRLESISRSPVYEQIASCLQGLATIRAFGQTKRYIEQIHTRLDRQAQASWHLYLFNRWFTFRINVLGAVFSTVTALAVVNRPGITGSMAGFALVFTNHLSFALVSLSRAYSTLEMDLNAVERILEYSDLPTENTENPKATTTPPPTPSSWPSHGSVSFTHLTAGYSPDSPAVLHDINLQIHPGQRIGIVGRTGAGKSTLALALFRFLDPLREGTITIDGIDIATLPLATLRTRLAMIPQNPVLFTGTIRSNLDPFDEHDDHTILQVLRHVHWPLASEADLGDSGYLTILSSPVSQAGQNFSHGQRQLLCLARAMLSRPAVFVMDEATSAVDRATDELIQRSIRKGFGFGGEMRRTTLLVIAHRIRTIADFDCVVVMDAGRVVEFGKPAELLRREGGVFRGLVEGDGDAEELRNIMSGM